MGRGGRIYEHGHGHNVYGSCTHERRLLAWCMGVGLCRDINHMHNYELDSNLPNIMVVATKVHMILRRFAVLTMGKAPL